MTPVRLRRAADRPDAQPIRLLLLHGLAGSPAAWDKFVQLTGDEFEVWDAVLPWSADGDVRWSHGTEAGEWVESAMTATPGGADVVIAHSFAANILLEVLERRSIPWPSAAVLVSPFHRPDPEHFDWESITYYLNGFHRILEDGLRVGTGDRLPLPLQEAMAMRVRDRIGPYGWMRFFDAYLRSPFLDTGSLDLPMLVVGGEADFAAKPDDARTLAKSLPAATLDIFGDCGHFPMVEAPERFAAVFGDFARTPFPDRTTLTELK